MHIYFVGHFTDENMRKIRHYRSWKAYRKAVAFIHMHHIKTTKPKHVIIAGHMHTIKHRHS